MKRTIFVLALSLASLAALWSAEKAKPPIVSDKPDSARHYVTLQYRGKEYVLIVPQKGKSETVVKVLSGSGYRQATPAEVEAIVDLAKSLSGAAFAGRVLTFSKIDK